MAEQSDHRRGVRCWDGKSDRDEFPVPREEKENPFARGGARGRKSGRDKGNRYPGGSPGAGRNKGQRRGRGIRQRRVPGSVERKREPVCPGRGARAEVRER